MAEPEDLLVDAARHTTVFVRGLWRRHRPERRAQPVSLSAFSERIDLLLSALVGRQVALRIAQPPARPSLLRRLLEPHAFPQQRDAVPASDGETLWLPAQLGSVDPAATLADYRTLALQWACRLQRGALSAIVAEADPLRRDVAFVIDALAADAAAVRQFPGAATALGRWRAAHLAARPAIAAFAEPRATLERWLRTRLAAPPAAADEDADPLPTADRLIASWSLDPATRRRASAQPLYRDRWSGEPLAPEAFTVTELAARAGDDDAGPTRSTRMARRPQPRAAHDGEDDGEPGAWMVQQDAPHEVAEDPLGLQRPIDRDEDIAADEFAELLSDLPSARIVSTPGRAPEVLLGDDPPARRSQIATAPALPAGARLRYPEWDHRIDGYHADAVCVQLAEPTEGDPRWAEATLARYRPLLATVGRQFELLRPEPVRLRRQPDGDDIDLDAWVARHAEQRSGGSAGHAIYTLRRRGQRSLAILLLADVSGSTDAWIGAQRRVIDVEREALLLVCAALQRVAAPHAVLTFSGEGPQGVVIRNLKRFDEHYDTRIGRRIAALEPERYTRAGAALRHATAMLMQQPASHRLLLLLSDGKPNDADRYEGRYGVEDTRQAVIEARLQGVHPFCLTIDRQAATYLPRIFGPAGHALLRTPERLPAVLLDWLRRLLAG